MKVLAVFSHPVRSSFCGALLDAFTEQLAASGHEADVLDLHRSDFNCAFQADDHAHFAGGPVPQDVARMQARIEQAQALAFVYPIYWWTFPALLRGWIDRVFTAGWAYGIGPAGNQPLLRDRPTVLIATAGAGLETIETFGYGAAMRRLIDEGTFGYCGLKDIRTVLACDVHEDADGRTDSLKAVRQAALDLAHPAAQ